MMIRKLQFRFIRIALTALAAAMVAVVLVVNAANWFSVRNELNETLSFLVETSDMSFEEGPLGRMGNKNRHARNLISESSWFSVSLDARGSVRGMELENMPEADEQEAASLAAEALQSGRSTGFLGEYLCS